MERSFTLLSSPHCRLAPSLEIRLWVPNTTREAGMPEKKQDPRVPVFSVHPQPQLPEHDTLAACSLCSPGASGLMNYESSLGVPTGAYGSAETRVLETKQRVPPPTTQYQCQFENQKLCFVNFILQSSAECSLKDTLRKLFNDCFLKISKKFFSGRCMPSTSATLP